MRSFNRQRRAVTVASTPRLCFLGPMLGRHPGYVSCQGLIVGRQFERAGYPTIMASSRINRYARARDLLATLLRYRRDIDIVCLEVYGGPSFIVEDVVSATARALRKRLIMVLHGGAMPEFMARHPRWTRRVLRRAHVLVAPSTFLKRAVEPHGLPVRVIPNVIDLSKYTYRLRRRLQPRLFWMRSFHRVYNPELAIRVLARVQREVPRASLVMAGQLKGAEDDVRRLAAAAGLTESVTWAGFLDDEGKRREGNAADIFLNTNRVDNMPVAVIEAAAMGLPVVATAVGGVPDLLEGGRYGLLVPDDDDAAMAGAVSRLLSDSAMASQLSQNGRQLAERSAWESVRPQWDDAFAQVMAQR